MAHDRYENPLISRYASVEMAELFSPQRKFSTWRRIWIALAQAQQELGLGVTTEQIAQLQEHVDSIDFDTARQYEKKLRHDVMAHVHAYGDVCPDARPIIHLGATSCFVTDNTDLIILREALVAVRSRLAAVIDQLGTFAAKTQNLATLGFTHLQPAQPTTVGKRACLWAYDLALDLQEVVHRIEQMQARSTKGTTGTQASFLKLLDGDHGKVKALESSVAEKLGFTTSYAVTGQTYSRKVDSQILDVLSGIAQSSHKAATDFRLLANRKELEEPFEKDQIGSSAMAYKRNPMRSERICSLARFVMSLQSSAANTMATQWMERTLDDSANRRLVLPQAFLAIDAVLILYQNITSGLVTYPQVIAKNLLAELPFMATENILMAAVAAGGDRQDLHERIRQHSLAAADRVKQQGAANDLMSRLAADDAFASVDLDAMMDASQFVGRAPEQVAEFIEDIVGPVRAEYVDGAVAAEVNV
ncbi:MAG: adenylosuccinate lyase [Planctomycetaceae bacterium]|jgi:adenylosuccinate lyase|nr:adenylosuccinate lyase [Planctomycetaceae bacterium]MBT4845264.1 adenylosuccinate lyase [Planctomycetaceae bacterium]MBT5125366.1 adenylosuccinate lyase [Planctomycetaceae bacterium]MBT5600443.1 adenylosuccinate lyase [Planctomycetaceae bacterium]MBT5885222.1 adenylosuccinate lyase [Planctomycetaceae bacterium]